MKIPRSRKPFSIPVSSMSDIAFLLLIFIMLVSLINHRPSIQIEYPEVTLAQETSTPAKSEIWIDAAGLSYLNGAQADLSAIEAFIIDAYRSAPDTRVHIIADRTTQFEKVNAVIAILQRLQYGLVSFAVRTSP